MTCNLNDIVDIRGTATEIIKRHYAINDLKTMLSDLERCIGGAPVLSIGSHRFSLSYEEAPYIKELINASIDHLNHDIRAKMNTLQAIYESCNKPNEEGEKNDEI